MPDTFDVRMIFIVLSIAEPLLDGNTTPDYTSAVVGLEPTLLDKKDPQCNL